MNPKIVEGHKPGGVFLLEAYTLEQIDKRTGGSSNPELLIAAEEIIPEIESLQLHLAHNIERDGIEGISHTGIGSTAQVIGEKI